MALEEREERRRLRLVWNVVFGWFVVECVQTWELYIGVALVEKKKELKRKKKTEGIAE